MCVGQLFHCSKCYLLVMCLEKSDLTVSPKSFWDYFHVKDLDKCLWTCTREGHCHQWARLANVSLEIEKVKKSS